MATSAFCRGMAKHLVSTKRAHAVREIAVGPLCDIRFDRLPGIVLVADFLAPGADGNMAAQGLDLGQGLLQLDAYLSLAQTAEEPLAPAIVQVSGNGNPKGVDQDKRRAQGKGGAPVSAQEDPKDSNAEGNRYQHLPEQRQRRHGIGQADAGERHVNEPGVGWHLEENKADGCRGQEHAPGEEQPVQAAQADQNPDRQQNESGPTAKREPKAGPCQGVVIDDPKEEHPGHRGQHAHPGQPQVVAPELAR